MEEFNNLNEESKSVIIFDADKVSKKLIHSTKYELFAIHDFFIETKTSISYDFKRTFLIIQLILYLLSTQVILIKFFAINNKSYI